MNAAKLTNGAVASASGASQSTGSSRRGFDVFGLRLVSEYRFRTPLVSCGAQTDGRTTPVVRFSFEQRATPELPTGAVPVYASPDRNSFGESGLQLYAGSAGRIMRFPRVADFVLAPGSIECALCDSRLEYMVEVLLFGHVLAYYLELSGLSAVHAGAVAVDERAVLLLGDRGAGKSTVLASLLQSGDGLLADDIAALEVHRDGVICRWGFPQLRLVPEQLSAFGADARSFNRFHPGFEKRSVPAEQLGAFASQAGPVAAAYVLERLPAGERSEAPREPRTPREHPVPGIETIAPSEALLQLVRHSFLSSELEKHDTPGFDGLDLRIARFRRLSAIAERVPVFRLRYETGYSLLPSVCSALRASVPQVPAQRSLRPDAGLNG